MEYGSIKHTDKSEYPAYLYAGKAHCVKIYYRTSFGGQAAIFDFTDGNFYFADPAVSVRPFSFAALPFGRCAIIVRMYNVSSVNKR